MALSVANHTSAETAGEGGSLAYFIVSAASSYSSNATTAVACSYENVGIATFKAATGNAL